MKENTEIISKLFHCFISHVTTSETETSATEAEERRGKMHKVAYQH